VTTTELLTIIAAAIVIVGLAWYLRGRRATGAESAAESRRNHRTAALLADDVHTEALIRHYCPQCGVEREFRDRACVECGYRLTT